MRVADFSGYHDNGNYSGLFDDIVSAGSDVFEQAGQTAVESLQTQIASTIQDLIPTQENEPVQTVQTVEVVEPVQIIERSFAPSGPKPVDPKDGTDLTDILKNPLILIAGLLFFL